MKRSDPYVCRICRHWGKLGDAGVLLAALLTMTRAWARSIEQQQQTANRRGKNSVGETT